MIKIETYLDDYKDQIIDLILSIQTKEFGICITSEQQPDIHDITGFYQTKMGNFWLALDSNKVVGTIALLDIGGRQAALRKMFVDSNYRGPKPGMAGKLLEELLDWSGSKGIREIYLGTTSNFFAAHRFYEKSGFSEIGKSRLPESFPVMKVDTKFYMKNL